MEGNERRRRIGGEGDEAGTGGGEEAADWGRRGGLGANPGGLGFHRGWKKLPTRSRRPFAADTRPHLQEGPNVMGFSAFGQREQGKEKMNGRKSMRE